MAVVMQSRQPGRPRPLASHPLLSDACFTDCAWPISSGNRLKISSGATLRLKKTTVQRLKSMGCRRSGLIDDDQAQAKTVPEGATLLFSKSFILALTALLPLINPIGSALVFLGLVRNQPAEVYRQLARKIAFSTFGFLIVIEFLGSLLLGFFGISLPIVQITGGIVIAATAWALLFEKDANAGNRAKHQEIEGSAPAEDEDLNDKIFYPFTFPITAGPGTLVVTITLGAHAAANSLIAKTEAYGGIALAAAVLSASVYLCYGYAPKLIKAVSPATVNGILRVIAFILMCIGVQIAWNGMSLLGMVLSVHH
jgi:multiple antibiotic resistance protein